MTLIKLAQLYKLYPYLENSDVATMRVHDTIQTNVAMVLRDVSSSNPSLTDIEVGKIEIAALCIDEGIVAEACHLLQSLDDDTRKLFPAGVWKFVELFVQFQHDLNDVANTI